MAGIEKPEDIPNIFINAWNRRDPAQLAGIFDEDAEFVNVVGLWWHHRNDIYRAHEYGLRVIFAESTLELRDMRIKWLSPDIAVIHARMRLSGQTAIDNVQPASRQTIFSFVVHRRENGWSCASAHNTEVIPGKETFVAKPGGEMDSVSYRRKDSR